MSDAHANSASGATQVEYREVPGFSDYQVGNDGSVWSLKRKRMQLKPLVWRAGCRVVKLWQDDKAHTKLVHRLVLEAFVGPCPEGMECCHNNGDASDNRLENLRWDTHTANMADKKRHGTQHRGEDSPVAKLTESEVLAIRRSTAPYRTIASQFGIHHATVWNIKRRDTWTHI